MSGRKNDELKKLKNKQTKFTLPSKKRRKTSQEESEYQKIMLENQEKIKRIEKEEEGQLKNFKSSLFEAIMKEKSVERVKSLLGKNKEIVARIINEEIDDSLTFLHLAVGSNNLEIAKLLLENGADTTTTDDSEENCFHYAAFRGNLEMLKLLAKYTKDIKSTVNTHSKTGLSVLHRAAVGVEKSDKN
jgi:ankyrin repeat protein